MAHSCPECYQYCTCQGDIDDIDFGDDCDGADNCTCCLGNDDGDEPEYYDDDPSEG
jgi:hypothetical protein